GRAPAAPSSDGRRDGGVYTVQRGDTLSGIAEEYDTTWPQLWADNVDVVGEDPDLILPGQELAL
ncbi:LysM domain-containing protein, partial [Streptomyces sp. DSM 44917]